MKLDEPSIYFSQIEAITNLIHAPKQIYIINFHKQNVSNILVVGYVISLISFFQIRFSIQWKYN